MKGLLLDEAPVNQEWLTYGAGGYPASRGRSIREYPQAQG